MAKKRRPHEPSFKAKVAIEAIRELHTVSQLASQYKVHGTQIHHWKRTVLDRANELFTGPGQPRDDVEIAELYQHIGKLQVEMEWLKKKSTRLD